MFDVIKVELAIVTIALVIAIIKCLLLVADDIRDYITDIND